MNTELYLTKPLDELELEEIMVCYYKKPARRISPGDPEAQGWERGSVMVKEKEVVLVLEPEDDSLYFKTSKYRVVGPPIKRFKGLLEGSRLYRNGLKTDFQSKEMTVQIRKMMKEVSRMRASGELRPLPYGSGLFEENSAGKLNDHRCIEAWGLAGMIAGSRWKKVFRTF